MVPVPVPILASEPYLEPPAVSAAVATAASEAVAGPVPVVSQPAAPLLAVRWVSGEAEVEVMARLCEAAGRAGLAVHAPDTGSGAAGTGLVLAVYAAATADAGAAEGSGGQGPCVYLLRASQLLGPGGSQAAVASLRRLLESEVVAKVVHGKEQASRDSFGHKEPARGSSDTQPLRPTTQRPQPPAQRPLATMRLPPCPSPTPPFCS